MPNYAHWFLKQSQRNLVVYCIVPRETTNNMQMHKFGKKVQNQPTLQCTLAYYSLHPTKIVPHAADRCAVILVPAFWGNSPLNKDKGELL